MEYTAEEVAEMQLQLLAAQNSLETANEMITAVATTLGRFGPPIEPPVITSVNNTVTGTGNNQHTYSGAWSANISVGGGAYQGDMQYVDGAGPAFPYVEFKFYGYRAQWRSEKHLNEGISAITLDGVSAGTVDQYAATSPGSPNYDQLLYDTGTLTEGVHTIRITATGTKNASATGYYLNHDRFIVYATEASPIPPPVDGDYDYLVTNDAEMTAACAAATAGQIICMRGGTYRGTYTLANSGTAGNNIVVMAYPTETVLISGLDTVSDGAWTSHDLTGGKAIYKATVSMPTRATIGYNTGGGADPTGYADLANAAVTNTGIFDYQVFDGGTMQIEARWPKGVQQYTDLLTLSATGSSTAPAATDTRRHVSDLAAFTTTNIQDNALLTTNGFPITSGGLVGATMNSHGWFIAETRTITAHSGNSINFSGVWNDTKVRKYYWLTGKLGFLTQQREFHYEGGILYFWAAGGAAPTGVEFKARNWGFNLKGKSYITITGINFKGCEPVQGNTSTTNCIIDNIKGVHTNHTVRLTRVHWQGYGTSQLTGLKLVGANNILRNSELSWGGSQGVWIGVGGTVQNNKIEYYGYDGMWGAGVAFWGEDNINNIKVLNNSIGYMGRGCIDNGYAFSEQNVSRATNNNEIGYNNMYGFAKLNQDSGAFYSWGWQNLAGCRFHHNWIHDDEAVPSPVPLAGGAGADGIMAGFYFDMGSGATVGQNPITIDHNVIWNIGVRTGWIGNDWSDIFTHPGMVETGSNAGWDYADRVAKQPSRYYNNTFAGNRKSYVTYQNYTTDIQRNNIYRKEINQNWGANPGNVANSLLQTSDPLFVGGSLSSPQTYFQLQSGSPARGIGTALTGYNDGDTSPKEAGAYYYGQSGWTAGYVSVPYNP